MPIPFEVPGRWIDLLKTGRVVRKGVNLVWKQSGKIAAHVQETGLLSRAVGAVNPVQALLSTASSLASNVQLEQVKSMLGTVQLLSGATLATSIVGIGVSVAGFAMVARRLRSMDATLGRIERGMRTTQVAVERIDVKLDARTTAEVQALLARAEEAWLRGDRASVWRELDPRLDEAQRYWCVLVGGGGHDGIFLDGRFSLDEAVAAHQTAVQLAAARVQNLLLLDEVKAAVSYARDVAQWHDEVTRTLNPPAVVDVRARAALATGGRDDDLRDVEAPRARRAFEAIRDAQVALDHRRDVLATIERRGISGREFIEELRERQQEVLVLLPVDDEQA